MKLYGLEFMRMIINPWLSENLHKSNIYSNCYLFLLICYFNNHLSLKIIKWSRKGREEKTGQRKERGKRGTMFGRSICGDLSYFLFEYSKGHIFVKYLCFQRVYEEFLSYYIRNLNNEKL